MNDTFFNGIYRAIELGFALWILIVGLAWIINLARHMFIGDD